MPGAPLPDPAAVRARLRRLEAQSAARQAELISAIGNARRAAEDSAERAAAEAEISRMQDLGIELAETADEAALLAAAHPALAADAQAALMSHRAAELAARTALAR